VACLGCCCCCLHLPSLGSTCGARGAGAAALHGRRGCWAHAAPSVCACTCTCCAQLCPRPNLTEPLAPCSPPPALLQGRPSSRTMSSRRRARRRWPWAPPPPRHSWRPSVGGPPQSGADAACQPLHLWGARHGAAAAAAAALHGGCGCGAPAAVLDPGRTSRHCAQGSRPDPPAPAPLLPAPLRRAGLDGGGARGPGAGEAAPGGAGAWPDPSPGAHRGHQWVARLGC
jgi:hypothetical protein